MLKIILTLTVISTFQPNHPGYSLRGDSTLCAQFREPIISGINFSAAPSNAFPTQPEIKNSPNPWIAFSLVVFPIIFTPIAWSGIVWDREAGFLAGLIIYNFGTIPAHIYVGDSALKITLIEAAKLASFSLLAIGFTQGLCGFDGGCEGKDTSFADAAVGYSLFINIGIYIYELIDVPSTAKHRREGFYSPTASVVPWAAPDRLGLAFQYNF